MKPSRRIRRIHARLIAQHTELARFSVAAQERRNPSESAWSVGEHLEHLALVNEGILAELARLEAAGYAGESGGHPTWTGRLILFLGFLPRGRGKAPDFVIPQGTATEELPRRFGVLLEQVQALTPKLGAIESCRGTLPHPLLGQFSASQWLRFADVHDRHHLAIIRDIER